MADLHQLVDHLQQQTGLELANCAFTLLGGGDINTAYKLQTPQRSWFIKINQASMLDMFAAEAAGLQELAKAGQVKVPEVVCYGSFQQYAYLMLEFIALGALRGESLVLLGRQLAKQHRQAQTSFGWHCDNTIGSTPQSNRRHDDWLTFWHQERLSKQLEFARNKGYVGQLQSKGEKLLVSFGGFFSGYQPVAALLHGDLWIGNAAADKQGNPVIYDPACYYGDREADIAMTELFGGFGPEFYASYQNTYPLHSGYQVRKQLYNLYHILNHLNLFGSGYQSQAVSMIERLLAELG